MGQASAALGAAAGQHLTAVSGGHSLAEAVLFLSLTLFGLISSEHFLHLLKFVFIPDCEISGTFSGSVLLYSQNNAFTQ